MIVVMNCVNLHSMKPAKWLSSPRWMGHRTGKVRTQSWRGGRWKAGVGEELRREKKGPGFPRRPAGKGAQQGACAGVMLRGALY